MVTVKISETFDLCTARNKLGLIGIHTPPRALIERHFGGLMNNHKAIRFTGADVYFACASTLPVDPNGVGVGAGQVNPSDLMNPVLYKAVSNEYFETVISRIYGGVEINNSSDGGSVTLVEGISTTLDPAVPGVDDFRIYYGMLSNAAGWKKAMPQSGFEMRSLKPYMWSMITSIGNENILASYDIRKAPVIYGDNGTTPSVEGGFGASSTSANLGFMMRGKASFAPPFPLWQGLSGTGPAPEPTVFPKIYVGAIIVPPCHTAGSRIYYRMRIVWHIEFVGLTSYQNFASFLNYNNNGNVFYYNGYENGIISKMERDTDMVDVNDMDIEKVMEAGS